MLTRNHLAEFAKKGYVVIENVLDDEEIAAARNAFHKELATLNIYHDAVLNATEPAPPECAIKSSVANIFYSKWKFDVHLHPKVVDIMRGLLHATFMHADMADTYPGPCKMSSDNVFAYIDRVCYRLPNAIRNEKGLDLHLDRHPTQPFVQIKKWRPIQAFVALTDHFGPHTGGLRVVPGFPAKIDEYFARGGEIKETPGEFFRMHGHAHDRLRKDLVTVQAPKGSLVCWDNRMAHATCAQLDGVDSREVVYVGFLPDVPLNRDYLARQKLCLMRGFSPPAYDSVSVKPFDSFDELNEEQKALLGFPN
jgi:hypothetical protein